MKRRIRAIYYWYYNTRSSPADAKQSKRSRVYHRKIQNFSNYLPFGNYANFGNYPDAADAKIKPKSQDYLLKIEYFCNSSLVSLSTHPRSPRGAQRIRKSEGRWSCPPKTFTRLSRPPKTFTCFIRSSPADVKQHKRSSPADVKQNKLVKRIRVIYYWYYNTHSSPTDVKENKRSRDYHRKIQNFSNYLSFGNDASFGNYPDAADAKIQPRSPPQNRIPLQLLPCLAQHPSAFTSRCPTDREGRGALEPPLKSFTCFTRSSPADVKAKQTNAQILLTSIKTNAREYATAKFKTLQ